MANFRVTYATLSADNEELHAAFEEGVKTARAWVGETVPTVVDGEARTDGEPFTLHSPNDAKLELATVHSATERDVDDAVAAAQAAFGAWSATPWQERVGLLRRAADLISERSNELAALMAMEVGKNRLEALGDVEESADLIRYYCQQLDDNDGFAHKMGQLSANEHTRSVLKPYGVWAVISPFNFPMALAAGPAGGALVAGNTVVLKPSPQGSFTGYKLYECLRDAGLPAGRVPLPARRGRGRQAGRGLRRRRRDHLHRQLRGRHEDLQGVLQGRAPAGGVRDGRQEPGHRLGQGRPRPGRRGRAPLGLRLLRAEVLGLLAGVRGAVRGRGVHRPPGRPGGPAAGRRPPGPRDLHGPGDRRRGRRPVQGGGQGGPQGGPGPGRRRGPRTTGLPKGNYVAPTVVGDLPAGHRLFKDELFVPFVAVAPVDSLDEALELANDTEYGLTAGFYSADQAEVDQFLDRIEAGVVYVNRKAGATTGAWPGVQPFGGWKGSGSSGKAGGGLYYVQQFMREQSQTVIS